MNENYEATSRRIEITGLVEVLQEIIDDGSKMPFSKKILVDKGEVVAILDEIVQAIPDDLRTAQWVIGEKDRLLTEARTEYERTKAEVDMMMKEKIDNHDIVREAQIKAQEIISKAQTESKMVRLSAREYADSLLSDLDTEIKQKNQDMMISFKNLFEGFVQDYNKSFNGTSLTIKENIKELREMK
ncbi:MAG: ATPase [Clostridiaceae bacterium]|jgi:vacuolar-type H+-ATPase subunit E/Vma4